ncbi:MAG: 4Fe-4S dicluster domain-containing protein [archaeon]
MLKIDIGRCIGCSHCVMACHPGTLKIVNKVSTIVAPETCDSEGRCIAACPQKAIP